MGCCKKPLICRKTRTFLLLLFIPSLGSLLLTQSFSFADVDVSAPATPTDLRILQPGESPAPDAPSSDSSDSTPQEQSESVFSGQTYFVDNLIGNDSNSGEEGNPWAHINYAAAKAQPGDTVFIVSNGPQYPYEEKVRPENSGAPDKWIVFKGIGEGKPEIFVNDELVLLYIESKQYLEFNNFLFPRSDGQGVVVTGNSQNIRLIDLTIKNIEKNGILVNNGGHIEIVNCELDNIGNNGIAFIGSSTGKLHDTRIEGCTISNVLRNDGITLHKNGAGDDVGAGHVLRGNRLFSNDEQGIDVTSGSDILLIDNKTFDNRLSGVVIGHGAKNVTIQGHESVSDKGRGIIISESENVLLQGSTIRDAGDGAELLIKEASNLNIVNNKFSSSTQVKIDMTSTGHNVKFEDNTVESTGIQNGPMFRCIGKCAFVDLQGVPIFVNNVWWSSSLGDERIFSDYYQKLNFSQFQILFNTNDRFEEPVSSEVQ